MAVADSITNALLRFGRPMVLRRLTWVDDVSTPTDVTVYGVTEGYLSQELVDGQAAPSNVKVTFSNAQIAAGIWPGPPAKLDQMVIDDGQVRNIVAVETKYLGPQVLVFICEVQPLSFDRYVRIERAVSTQDEYGSPVTVWSELATVEASKVDISGNEGENVGEVSAVVLSRFRIRWSSVVANVSPLDRVVYPAVGGRIYDIQTVKEQQLKVGLEIFATARSETPPA